MGKILKHYKNGELVYPNPTKDGLQLWYDVAGKRNTDFNKEVLEDLSGNGNDGVLQNFNFTEESGYNKNKLLFDGVDDQLQIPDLQLSENAMSVQVGDKVYVYEDDKVITISEDGSVEVGGVNLISDSHFYGGVRNEWSTIYGIQTVENHILKKVYTSDAGAARIEREFYNLKVGQLYTLTMLAKTNHYLDWSGLVNMEQIDSIVPENPTEEDGFQLFTITFKALSNSVILRGYQTNPVINESFIEIDWFTLVKGNKYTPDWIPASEDFQTTSLSLSSLSNLQLYNRPLVKDEMLQNAESEGLKELKEGQVVQDGLVLHYDFSHESNTGEYKDKAFDYSGNGNHGELQNFNFTEESGYVEDGLKFDGVDDYLHAEKIPFNNSITIEAVASLESAASYAPIFRLSPADDWRTGLFYFGSSNDFNEDSPFYRVWVGTKGDSGVVQHMGIGTFNPGQIYHLSCVLDSENKVLSVFSNGQLLTSFEHEIIPIDNNNTVLHIARQYNTERIFKGNYFSSKLYNRVLTPEEIQHNYQIEKEKFNL